ncbi:MAG: ABC-three component system middle component 5 [Pseudomonadota bacterium]
MKSRLWYPQLDVASAARRFVRILDCWQEQALSIERLFVFDYFIATPALIGDIKMTASFRRRFGELALPKKSNEFIIFPPAALLFHSMTPIQKRALVSLVAKEIVDKVSYETGTVVLTDVGRRTATELSDIYQGEAENIALEFMTSLLSTKEFANKSDLRNRTGLRYYD